MDDGGSDVTSYSIEKKEEGSDEGAWQVVATVADRRAFLDDPSTAKSSLSHSVTQLSPGVMYQFRVSAVNRVGVRGRQDNYSRSCLRIELQGWVLMT